MGRRMEALGAPVGRKKRVSEYLLRIRGHEHGKATLLRCISTIRFGLKVHEHLLLITLQKTVTKGAGYAESRHKFAASCGAASHVRLAHLQHAS